LFAGFVFGALGRYHNAERFAFAAAFQNVVYNHFIIVRDFRHQYNIAPARNGGTQGNPPRIAAHGFHNHYPVVALGGGVQAVNGFRGNGQGGVKAEGLVRRAEVVINGFGNGYNRHT